MAFQTLLGVAMSMCVVSSALAATITVDDNGPADFSTIQAAINAAVDGDVVLVKPGTYTAAGAAAVVNFGVRAITLVSESGADATIIDGQDVRRCITVQLNSTSATKIKGFKLYRGRNAVGAGMYVVNSSPTIEDCKFHNCVATGGAAAGGGLRFLNSNSVVRDCEFQSNSADNAGGGMFNANGAVSVFGCDFFDNSGGSYGGGLFNEAGTMLVMGCDFARNAACRGSGVFTRGDDSLFSATTFRHHNSPCGGAVGGGLAAESSTCTVNQCVFSGNLIDDYCRNYGGGACVFGDGAAVTFNTCEFLSNRATCNGTGAALAVGIGGVETGDATLNDCEFLSNFSDLDGGAIAFQSWGTLALDRCLFEANSAGRFGGAVVVNYYDFGALGTLLIDDCQFTGNSAGSRGGAIWSRQNYLGAQRAITDSVFTFNVASNGGGLWLDGTTTPLRMGDCAFCGNDPSAVDGSINETAPNCFSTVCADNNGNGFPDTCDPVLNDCNGNLIDDDEELLGNDANNDHILDECQALDFAGLITEIQPITHMLSGLPTTAVSWRVYATFTHPNASVFAINGNIENPLLISSTAGFYQSATGGNTVEDIACNSSDASLLYDSFFTIGAECRSEVDLQVTPGFSFSSFNETTNAILSTSNGAIYVLPGNLTQSEGKDNRVLLMQLTTKSAVKPTATINLVGDNGWAGEDNEWWAYGLPIPDPQLLDCDGNGVHDAIDIALGTLLDCDLDGVPDTCGRGDLTADCDMNGVPDACEIRLGSATDNNTNGVPDNCECMGDVDHNGAVNVDDLLEILIAWGDPTPGDADLTGDGIVDSQDLVMVLQGWGTCL